MADEKSRECKTLLAAMGSPHSQASSAHREHLCAISVILRGLSVVKFRGETDAWGDPAPSCVAGARLADARMQGAEQTKPMEFAATCGYLVLEGCSRAGQKRQVMLEVLGCTGVVAISGKVKRARPEVEVGNDEQCGFRKSENIRQYERMHFMHIWKETACRT